MQEGNHHRKNLQVVDENRVRKRKNRPKTIRNVPKKNDEEKINAPKSIVKSHGMELYINPTLKIVYPYQLACI